ncbi:MAG: hypothetical protein ACQESG_00730 [Nanobdellota archaeon]
MLKIVILGVLFIAGCGGETPEQTLSDEFIPDSDMRQTIAERIDSKVHVPEETTAKAGKADAFYVGVNNVQNKTLCFYLQPTCQIVLGGLNCDAKTMSDNTRYYWDWFYLPNSVFMKPGETTIIQGRLKATGSQDTYLGEFNVWAGEPTENQCRTVKFYNEKKDLTLYSQVDFQVTLE